MTELVIIRGLPGSGKSTYAKKHYSGYIHIEADQYFVNSNGIYEYKKQDIITAHAWCYDKVVTHLNKGENVVVSNTFTRLKFIIRYICISIEVNVSIVEMLTDYGSIHNVPEAKMKKMKKAWQEIPENWIINVTRVK